MKVRKHLSALRGGRHDDFIQWETGPLNLSFRASSWGKIRLIRNIRAGYSLGHIA